ncbi:hypothetical protein ACO0QE_000426 [Hanseniaspora vineae]
MTTVLFDYTNQGASSLPRCYDISSVRVLVVGDRGVGKSTLIDNLFASNNIKNYHEHGFQGFHGYHEVRGNRVLNDNGYKSEDVIHKKTDYTNLLQSKSYKEFKDKDINQKCLFSDFALLHENDGDSVDDDINNANNLDINSHAAHLDGVLHNHNHEHIHAGHSGYKFLQQFPQIIVKDYPKMKFNCDLSLDVQIVESSNESFQNYFSDIKKVQIHQTDVFLLCFDPAQPQSLENLKTTFSVLITHLDPMEQSYEYSIYFVCTKADSMHYKNYYLQIKEFLQNFKINILKNYYIVSSKMGHLHGASQLFSSDSEDNEEALVDDSEDDSDLEEEYNDSQNNNSEIDFALSIGSPRSHTRTKSRSQSFSPLLHHPRPTKPQRILSVDELFFRVLKNYETWRSYCRNGTWDIGTASTTSGTVRSASPESSARYSSIYPTSMYLTASARNTPTLSTSDSANNSTSNIAHLNCTTSFVSAPAIPTHVGSTGSENQNQNQSNNNNNDNNNDSGTNIQESSTKSLFVVSSDVKKSSYSSSNLMEQRHTAVSHTRVAEIKSPIPIPLSKQNSLQRTTQDLERASTNQDDLLKKTSNTEKTASDPLDSSSQALQSTTVKAQKIEHQTSSPGSVSKASHKTTSNKDTGKRTRSNIQKSNTNTTRKIAPSPPPPSAPTKQKSSGGGGCCIIM